MPDQFISFRYCHNGKSLHFLGAFASPADVVHHLNENSSGSRPFVGEGIATLQLGETVACSDFPGVTVYVTRLHLTKRAKNIYITKTLTATTSKSGATILQTVPLATCPVCGNHTVAADEDGHCSYACATGN